MRFDEIGLKDLVLDFDSNDLQDITIVQGDTKTRGFKVLVSTNNGEIIKASSQYEMRLYGVNSNYPDKSFFTKGVIDGDFYKVYISTDMASKSGKLQLQLALFEGTNALIQSRIKEVDVYRSIANGGNIGKDLVVDFGKLRDLLDRAEIQQKKFDESLIRQESIESDFTKKHTEVVQIRDGLKDVLTTENARVEAEKKRVSAEQTRVSQESTRQSNESTRQSNETARQQNESTRTSQETQRQAEESTRKSEEQKRISAESSRNSEETKRDNAEKIRIENENKRISAENKRSENDTQYNKNEATRVSQESTRQSQEQSRVDAEKQRISQETTRKQSEDTRNSQESTRQSQEQSRVDAESKRETSEATREKSEKTRTSKETERQNAEQTRQSNEDTRQQQESDRVEAEKQRAKAESDRAGKFAGWDKTMSGVIPTATSTVAGIVRIDVDGESMAVSKKTFDEYFNELAGTIGQMDGELRKKANEDEFYNSLEIKADKSDLDKKSDIGHTHTTADITNLETVLSTKASKEDIDKLSTELTEKVDNFKVEAATSKTAGIVKIDVDGESTAISKKSFDENVSALYEAYGGTLNDINAMFSETNVKINEKADKNDVVTKRDLETNTNELAEIRNLFNQFNKDVASALDEKSDKSHKHSIADITNLQAKLDEKANDKALSRLGRDMLYKINSDIVKNIFIIEKGASTTSIPANSLIFEKE